MRLASIVAGVALSASLLVGPSAQAEDIDYLLPGEFRPVSDLSHISADDICIVVGEDIKPQYFYLTNQRYNASSPKLRGKALEAPNSLPSVITSDDVSIMWRLTPQTDGTYTLKNVETDLYIYAPKTGATDLELNATAATPWNMTRDGDAFLLQNAQAPGRYLGVNNMSYAVFFGHYNSPDSKNIYIYKLAQQVADMPGEATMPANGAQVGLYANEHIAGKSCEAISASDYLLCTQELATSEDVGKWTCSHTAEGFTLQDETGKYLSYDLTASAAPVCWRIENGYVATAEATPRYLLFAGGNFYLQESTSDTPKGWTTVLPISFAAEPEMERETYTIKLSGGWRASELAAIDWADARCLDLTQATLPQRSLPFDEQPANSIIFVSGDDAPFIPTYWNFVVNCTGCENRLLRQVKLTDGEPLVTDRPIVLPSGFVTYTRQIPNDNGWATMYLPFDTELPADFVAAEMDESDAQNDLLSFITVESITANKPTIVQYVRRDVTTETVPFAVSNTTEATLQPITDAGPLTGLSFNGTYLQQTIAQQAAFASYMLNASGTAFQRAAPGSHLSPFRAMLSQPFGAAAATLRYNISAPRCDTKIRDAQH